MQCLQTYIEIYGRQHSVVLCMWIYRTQRIRSLGEDKAILIIKHPGRSRIFLCVETYQILFRKKTMGRLTLSLERVQVLGTSTLTEVLSSSVSVPFGPINIWHSTDRLQPFTHIYIIIVSSYVCYVRYACYFCLCERVCSHVGVGGQPRGLLPLLFGNRDSHWHGPLLSGLGQLQWVSTHLSASTTHLPAFTRSCKQNSGSHLAR